MQAWSPYLQKDITLLENVQRRATKLVRRLKNKEYGERLRELKLTKLEYKRIRGDMILTYRLLKGEVGIEYNKTFTLSDDHYNLRGHSWKLVKTREHLNVRRNFFSKRVIDKWNGLSVHEVEATSTSTFKIRYDKMENERQRINRSGLYEVRHSARRTGLYIR